MLRSIRDLLGLDAPAGTPPDGGSHGPYSPDAQVAVTALLHAMANADFEVREEEEEHLRSAVGRILAVERDEARSLLERGAEQARESVSLYDFTAVLQRQLDLAQKIEVVELLWAVAFADGEIDPQEEFLVRKVAKLLHLPHREFIAAKRRARDLVTG